MVMDAYEQEASINTHGGRGPAGSAPVSPARRCSLPGKKKTLLPFPSPSLPITPITGITCYYIHGPCNEPSTGPPPPPPPPLCLASFQDWLGSQLKRSDGPVTLHQCEWQTTCPPPLRSLAWRFPGKRAIVASASQILPIAPPPPLAPKHPGPRFHHTRGGATVQREKGFTDASDIAHQPADQTTNTTYIHYISRVPTPHLPVEQPLIKTRTGRMQIDLGRPSDTAFVAAS
ncbi:hypothetical protein L249_2471 [Ophiocordyceps polyrhachis-furcata BCC 54312]|uniref:Uncharacterized protein n=1 Tax=Ophiocordyceps polyrhachis-furcata BCC 54312 TaxID=1330021 RepID=A0A367LPS0_9HYPO|nr:hypothetical protein L249_2471 [Ophiocordyceps polyrhachis-furcata BCC 54312]